MARITDQAETPAGVELLTTAQQNNTVEFDEEGLADRSIAGDRHAFETLYTHYFPKVRGFCLRKLGNADLAEDIAQEAFAKAFERISDFGGPRHFGGWVGTIAANLCTDWLRRKKNMPVPLDDSSDTGPSYEVDPIRNIQRQDTGRLVRLALEKLEPRHREALLLHEVRGLSCAAVGEQLGISEVAAESLLARARRRLRKEITAKAAPADLFGLGGLGLLPALLRAWKRARYGIRNRTTALQSAFSRSTDGVGAGLVPSLDAAKALVVVVGAALVVQGGAGAGTPQVSESQIPTGTALAAAAPVRHHLPVDGDLGGTQGDRPVQLPVQASFDPQTGGVGLKSGGAVDGSRDENAAGLIPGLEWSFGLQSGGGTHKTVIDARVTVGGEGQTDTEYDTGDLHHEIDHPW